MKETDSLENQLRSSQPRRPSAGLRRKLFGDPVKATRRVAWFLGSLAPAAACLLLTISVFNPGNYGGSTHLEPMVLGNQSSAVYASGNDGGTENNLFSVTFDWTNHGNFTSSISPFSRSR
jgi:hypothetical protein